MKTFQKPLTLAQERFYLQQYQEGNEEAKKILIERNLRLVAHIVKKYQGGEEDLDIDNELLMMFRSRKKFSREISLYEPIGTDKEGNEISLLDVIESPLVDVVEDYSIREDLKILFQSIDKVLNPREYQVICCRFGLFGQQELTQREIARQMGISRSYVSRIEKNALTKLRELFPAGQRHFS